jgi:hypothetical protein
VSAVAPARRFARDVLASLTWRKLLLSQLLALTLELIAELVFVLPAATRPASFSWSRIVVDETMALSILMAVVIADQAVARGCRPLRTYALSVLAASIVAAVSQFQIRAWLGVHTLADRPGVDVAVRRTQMIYVFSDALTYGGLFTLALLDFRRREYLLRRMRLIELERARNEQQLAKSKLATLAAHVDAEELLTTLGDVHELFLLDAPSADRRLDTVIDQLRARLAAS